MIDLLLPILAAAGGLIWLFRRARARTFFLAMLAASAAAHGASVLSLYRAGVGYEYVTVPSPASEAGLRGPGTVVEANGERVEGLGALLGVAFFAPEASFRVAGGEGSATEFRRAYPTGHRWLFWRAVDSYALEEAAGGLALLPRRPIYHLGRAYLFDHMLSTPQKNVVRLVSVAGKATPTIGAFLAELARMPANGVVPVQYMRPSTDSGQATAFFSFLALPKRKEFSQLPPVDQAQPLLGLSGLPVVRKFLPGQTDSFFAAEAGAGASSGPAALGRSVFSPPLRPAGTGFFSAILRPRAALFSWVGPHAAATLLVGYAGIFLRQLLSLADLPVLLIFWDELPKQLYALDDSLGTPTLFFKAASLAASLALSVLLLGLALRHRAAPAWVARRRGALTLVLVMLFQVADLFVIRLY